MKHFYFVHDKFISNELIVEKETKKNRELNFLYPLHFGLLICKDKNIN